MKLLVVDDEANTRNGLQRGIDWSTLGIEKVLVAADGTEAYDLFLRFAPDILITDIRMPGLDGLELARKVREKSRAMKILILSAYSDFAYAKSALQTGVNEYELKPLKISRLRQIIAKFQLEIRAEEEQRLQEREREATRQRDLITTLINGTYPVSKNSASDIKKLFQFDAVGKLVCLSLALDGYHRLPLAQEGGEQQTAIDQAITTLLLNYWKDFPTLVYSLKEGAFFLIVRLSRHLMDEGALRKHITNFHTYVNKEVARLLSTTVSLGVSSGEATALPELASDAHRALKHKFYAGPGSLFFAKPDNTGPQRIFAWPDETHLSEAIKAGNLTWAISLLSAFFETLKGQRCTDVEYVKESCVYLRLLLINTLKEQRGKTRGIPDERMYAKLSERFVTIDEYKDWLCDLYKTMITAVVGVQSVIYSPAILRAVEYTRRNFCQDISSEMVAKTIEISPNYFSHRFNREMGMSFREYLNMLRVEEAKRLFQETNLKGYEIAAHVGFQDYTYFVQVFKKMEGVAPSHYRKPGKPSQPEDPLTS